MTRMVPLSLDVHLNSNAATWDSNRAASGVNAWGNSFPAEELPFGGFLEVDRISYKLPFKKEGGFDHVETLGQCISLDGLAIEGIAILCFGEMGNRRWRLRIEADLESTVLDLDAPGWLLPRGMNAPRAALACGHLHYPGDYELDHLRPVLWSVTRVLPHSLTATQLVLPEQPFVHILAITLLTEV